MTNFLGTVLYQYTDKRKRIMHLVEPKIFLLSRDVINTEETLEWLDFNGVTEEKQQYWKDIIQENSAGSALSMLAGKKCYMSFEIGLNPNVTKIRRDIVTFIDNILKTGHGSILEHVKYTFAFENVSRVFTAELNRHRAGVAISEASLRYIRFENLPVWIPQILQEGLDTNLPESKKKRSRDIFVRAFQQMEENYHELLAIWQYEMEKDFHTKKVLTSMMRRIIGLGVATGMVWSGNLRELRHVISMRVDASAEEEIAYVFSLVLKRMIEEEPEIFADFEQTSEGFWKPKYWKV